jgi:hypothetical protein
MKRERFVLAAVAAWLLSLVIVYLVNAQPPALPKGSEPYAAAKYTQEIAVTDGRNRITAVLRTRVDAHWRTSGGMLGLEGWKSEKFRYLPSPPVTRIGDIRVLNHTGYYQLNKGIIREYADGTRFDDVLSFRGKVFEHRVRTKVKGVWRSSVIFTDVSARPPGYKGLKQSCASCHDLPGTGAYAAPLIPGSDGTFSDPLNWRAIGQDAE